MTTWEHSLLPQPSPAVDYSIALFFSELQVGPARKGGYLTLITMTWASMMVLVVKNPPVNAGYVRDVGSIPE